MQIFLRWEVFHQMVGQEAIQRLREGAAKDLQTIVASGKVTASGVFADARGGFFVLDVESAEELTQLLAETIIDNCRLETHPVYPVENLLEFFKRMQAG